MESPNSSSSSSSTNLPVSPTSTTTTASLEDLLSILCKEITSTNWVAQQPSNGPNIFDLIDKSLLNNMNNDEITGNTTVGSCLTVDSFLQTIDSIPTIPSVSPTTATLPSTEATSDYIKTIPITATRTRASIDDEIRLQTIAALMGFAPKIRNVRFTATDVIITMEKLPDMCLADKYGDDPKDLPPEYWDQIRTILGTLYTEGSIEYIDITPYNFIEVNDKIFIIDFGDAYVTKEDRNGQKMDMHYFLKDFLDGYNGWNPDFK